jgi:hypothetical protein
MPLVECCPLQVHLYFFGRRTWSGDPCCETLAKTRPIGLERLPAYPAGRNGRCGRNLGGDCQRRGDAARPFLVARSATLARTATAQLFAFVDRR